MYSDVVHRLVDFFVFNDTATTEIYTLSLHDALPIRLDPALPSPLTKRAVIWRARGDIDRAIADTTEAIRLAKLKAPVNIMTPPGSTLISALVERGLAHEAKGDYASAKQDYSATIEGPASDAGSKSNQATARVRLSLLSDAAAPAPRNTT